jgi:hypothetical protein
MLAKQYAKPVASPEYTAMLALYRTQTVPVCGWLPNTHRQPATTAHHQPKMTLEKLLFLV